jgi:hypothetical protein
MAPRSKLLLGGQTFTMTGARAHLKTEILDAHADGMRVAAALVPFLHDALALHHHREQKIGVGISHFTVDTAPGNHKSRCVHIVRTDGTSTDVGIYGCLGNKPRSLETTTKAALRLAVAPQIAAARDAAFANGPFECPILPDGPMAPKDTHVDHVAPLTFNTLVDQWLATCGLTIAQIQCTGCGDNVAGTGSMADVAQTDSWTAFHAQHAELQVVSALANLSACKLTS